MAKKKSFKKQSKKASTRKQVAKPVAIKPTAAESKSGMREITEKPAASVSKKTAGFVADASMAYVSRDVKRIGLIVGSFIILQLCLAYLLNSTSFGQTVYNLIKI
jgi:hypothetical protein